MGVHKKYFVKFGENCRMRTLLNFASIYNASSISRKYPFYLTCGNVAYVFLLWSNFFLLHLAVILSTLSIVFTKFVMRVGGSCLLKYFGLLGE